MAGAGRSNSGRGLAPRALEVFRSELRVPPGFGTSPRPLDTAPLRIRYIYIVYVEHLWSSRERESDAVTPRRMGYATLAVLQALTDGHRYGFDIADQTGLATGTVYPALSGLERRGYVEADWEEEETAHADRRPARKYYRVTQEGRAALREALSRLGALGLRTGPAEAEAAG